MIQRPPLIVISVCNPAAFSGKGSIILLEYTDEDAAKTVARRIAMETGRAVTIRGEDMREIEAIAAAPRH
jgi:hypothetical protein